MVYKVVHGHVDRPPLPEFRQLLVHQVVVERGRVIKVKRRDVAVAHFGRIFVVVVLGNDQKLARYLGEFAYNGGFSTSRSASDTDDPCHHSTTRLLSN